jgi:hypothetical protein
MPGRKILDIIPPKKEILPKILEEKKPLEIKRKKGRGLKKGLIFIFLFLILIFISLHFFLNRAEIKIWLQTEEINIPEKVTIDTKIEQSNFSEKIIAGKTFEKEKSASREFTASGRTFKEEKAKGIIRIYNNYQFSQTLVTNTRFQPPLEKVLYFRSIKTVVVPAKSELDVEVVADRGGEEYNIGPSTFSIPGLTGLPQYYSIYGKSLSAMTGGFRGEVSQVTQKDLDEAKKFLLEKIKKEIEDSIKTNLPADYILLDGSIFQEVTEESSSAKVGDITENFTFNLKISSKPILLKKADFENFAKELISLSIQETDKKILQESLKVNYAVESTNKEKEEVLLNLEISVKIYSDIDLTELKRNLLGKSLEETKLILEGQPQINRVQLKTFPFWLKEIPREEEKVKIELNFQ